jgi:Ca2+-binding RTX toxin-like protein
VLTVEGVTIHVIEGTVTLQLDNDNSTLLHQTALTSIIQPNDPTPHQTETASVDGNAATNVLVDPTVTPGTGAGSAENSVNYLYGADNDDELGGANDTEVINGGAGRDTPSGGAGNDILIYDLADQKIDGGDGFDLLRTDEAALRRQRLARLFRRRRHQPRFERAGVRRCADLCEAEVEQL